MKIKKRCDSYETEKIKDERKKARAAKELSFCYVIEGNKNYAIKYEKLLEKAGKTKFQNPGMLSIANNHELRKSSAFGIASIVVANENESKKIFRQSQLSFARVIMFQSAGEAVWG